MPTIAAVNGPAIGAGLCLALACDIRYAAAGARLGAPFVKLGMNPGMAATHLLPDVVGEAHARELLLTGRTVDAEEALRLGLVTRVFADDELAGAVDEIAVGIAATAPIPSRYTTVALREGPPRPRGGGPVGGPRAAGHAGHRRPAGGHPGAAREKRAPGVPRVARTCGRCR